MRVVALSLFLLLSAVCAPALAQTAPLEEKQKAVMAFNIRVDQIRDSKLGKELNLGPMLDQMQAQSGDDGPSPSSIDQVFGAMSAPETLDAAMQMQSGKMTLDFFVQMTMNDPASVTKLMAKAEEENAGTAEHDGSTFYMLPANGGPEGVMVRKVNDKTVEMGTKGFLFRPDRKPFTDNLQAALKNAPKGDIRIVMDLNGAKGLLAQAVEMGKGNPPHPMVPTYLELVDNMKDMAISINLTGGDLLSLKATGVNEADATELKEGLDSLLGIAKFSIKGMLPTIRAQDPDGAVVVEKLTGSLNAKSEGTIVSINIPTPEGFDSWVVKQVGVMQQMMGGGMAPSR